MNSHQQVIREWLRKSEQDYEVACELFQKNAEGYAESIAFHLQQCIEKLFKSVLVKHRQPVPKTHDLELLAEKINSFYSETSHWLIDLERLTVLGIAARYPGMDVSLHDLKQGMNICNLIRSKLLPSLKE